MKTTIFVNIIILFLLIINNSCILFRTDRISCNIEIINCNVFCYYDSALGKYVSDEVGLLLSFINRTNDTLIIDYLNDTVSQKTNWVYFSKNDSFYMSLRYPYNIECLPNDTTYKNVYIAYNSFNFAKYLKRVKGNNSREFIDSFAYNYCLYYFPIDKKLDNYSLKANPIKINRNKNYTVNYYLNNKLIDNPLSKNHL
jgi:galactose-1-phosphate uridylyltransferase